MKKTGIIKLLVLAVLIGTLSGCRSANETVARLFYDGYEAARPVFTSNDENKETATVTEFDFYVSKSGSDENDGSENAPFLTIEKAVQAVRNTDKAGKDGISVCVSEGEYRVSSVVFTEADSGTEDCPITYYADGEAVLNGGVTLSPADFSSVKEYPEIAQRLCDEAKENVYVIDLTKAPYSLTAQDWGKIYAIGSYNSASKYDGDYTGALYCELFVNDRRQTLARYPDEGFLYTEEVVKTGLGRESDGALTAVEGWDKIRNPEPDVYRVNEELAARIGSWKTLDDVWMMGYWKYDWADASTLIGEFDEETGILSPAFVSVYGTKTGAPYYFFNVAEELTTAGEWYLDRENGLLCLWATENFRDAEIDLSLSLNPIINAASDYLTFDGFTIKGTRGDAVTITGNNNTVKNCIIKNVAGNALSMKGSNNLAYNNEITRTGKGGIYIEGGNVETLTPGNSRAENNYIHDWSEIYLTYQPAVTLSGVGNVCSHNEMANSPHEAITWSGNNHIIEYNLIRDVCLLSDDAGAIYSGRRWDWYGTVIRYNAIYNIGGDGHTPDGIYLDDALSGISVYGNLLVNIPKLGIHLGGGRDLEVTGNVIINAGKHALVYDARAREGALEGGWFTHAAKENGSMWTTLYKSPWQTDIWQQAYPQYKDFIEDAAYCDEPGFIPNPAGSTVKGNLIFDKKKSLGDISDAAARFSDVSGNAIFFPSKLDDFFVSPGSGDYTVKDLAAIKEILPDFAEIPLDEIGRK